MEMEMHEGRKRPRFLWIIVVGIVAASLTVFFLIQSGRMKMKKETAEVEPVAPGQVEQPTGPGALEWPQRDTAEAEVQRTSEETQPSVREPDVPVVVKKKEEAPPVKKVVERPEKRPKKPAQVATRKKPGQPLLLPTSDTGRYVVQVGSYGNEPLARVQVDKMARFGYKAWVEEASPTGKGRVYRVRVGWFDALADARRVAASMEEILQNGCWVDQR